MHQNVPQIVSFHLRFHRSKDFEAMKAGKLTIRPKCQFLFHKNLPPRDFSIMTLYPPAQQEK